MITCLQTGVETLTLQEEGEGLHLVIASAPAEPHQYPITSLGVVMDRQGAERLSAALVQWLEATKDPRR